MDKTQENNKPIKNRERFKKVLTIVILVVSIVALAVEGIVYYQRRYLTPFWVNGQSMYPYLNEDARNADGELIGEIGGSALEGYTVDYGVMDEHKAAIKKLKRFDIVVTGYKKNDTNNKIKRILALPGETIEFVVTEPGKEGNGTLKINGQVVAQPLTDYNVQKGTYPTGSVTLGDDEFYVCGDNRNHSQDSRLEGPIKRAWITGKAIAICGTCTVYKASDGTLDIKNIHYSWPRYLK